MKKFMKVCAITALILVVAGLILGTVGGTLKGRSTLGEVMHAITGGAVKEEEVDQWKENVQEDVKESLGQVHYELEDNLHFDNAFSIWTGDVERFSLGNTARRLDVEAGACYFSIKPSEDGECYLEAENMRRLQGYVQDGTLYVRGTAKHNTQDWDGSITLYIPEDMVWTEVDMEIGAGVLEFSSLTGNDVAMEVGAGRILGKNLSADKMELVCGMGQIDVNGLQTGQLETEVGMGQIIFSGRVTGKLDGTCAMGSLEMTLDGSEQDYDYSLECGMGEIDLNGNVYSGIAKEQYVTNGAASSMELECSMGNIKVSFAN